ncbi:MAG: FHA domain-containing protein [Planctomycetota bacterium]
MLTLIQIQGDGKGRALRFRSTRPQVLGRRVIKYRLDDSRISRQHAQIDFDHGSWRVTDLNSSNGTYLNAQRVDPSAPLRIGDHLQIGRLLFEVTTAAAPAQAEPAPPAEPIQPDAETTEARLPAVDAPSPDDSLELDLDAILGLDEPAVDQTLDPDHSEDDLVHIMDDPTQAPSSSPAEALPPDVIDLDAELDASALDASELAAEEAVDLDQPDAEPDDASDEEEQPDGDEASTAEADAPSTSTTEPSDAPPLPVGLSLEHDPPQPVQAADPIGIDTHAESEQEQEPEPQPEAVAEHTIDAVPLEGEAPDAPLEPDAEPTVDNDPILVDASPEDTADDAEEAEFDGLIASLIEETAPADENAAEATPTPPGAEAAAPSTEADEPAPADNPDNWTAEQLDAALDSITGEGDEPEPSTTESKANPDLGTSPDAQAEGDERANIPGFDSFVSDWLESEKPTDQAFDAEDWQPEAPTTQGASDTPPIAGQATAPETAAGTAPDGEPSSFADQATQLRAMAAAFEEQAGTANDAADQLGIAPEAATTPQTNDPQTPEPTATVTLLGPAPEPPADTPTQATPRRRRAALLGLLVLAPLGLGVALWQTVGKPYFQPDPVTGFTPPATAGAPADVIPSNDTTPPGDATDRLDDAHSNTDPQPSAIAESVIVLKSARNTDQDAASLFDAGPEVIPSPARPAVTPTPNPSTPRDTVKPADPPKPTAQHHTDTPPSPLNTAGVTPPPAVDRQAADAPHTPTTLEPSADRQGTPPPNAPVNEQSAANREGPGDQAKTEDPVGPLAIAEPIPDDAIRPVVPVDPEPVVHRPALIDVDSPVVFLVDASGSLVDSMPLALSYLNQKVQALPEDAEFTVVFFRLGQAQEPMKPGLRTASPATKRSLAAYLDPAAGYVRPEGRSSIDQALEQALTYAPKTLYILSDNAMGRSDRSDPDQTADALLTRVNQAVAELSPVIHTVQFFYDDPDGLLRSIAEQHDGQFQLLRGTTAPVQADPLDLQDLLTR